MRPSPVPLPVARVVQPTPMQPETLCTLKCSLILLVGLRFELAFPFGIRFTRASSQMSVGRVMCPFGIRLTRALPKCQLAELCAGPLPGMNGMGRTVHCPAHYPSRQKRRSWNLLPVVWPRASFRSVLFHLPKSCLTPQGKFGNRNSALTFGPK